VKIYIVARTDADGYIDVYRAYSNYALARLNAIKLMDDNDDEDNEWQVLSVDLDE
jgi:hypothetical protein